MCRFNAVGKALLDAGVELGAIAKAAQGLKALAQTDDNGKDEETKPCDNAHAGNGGIAIHTGRKVERDGRKGGQALA